MKKLIFTIAAVAGFSCLSFGQASQAPAGQAQPAMNQQQAAQRDASMKKQADAMAERQTRDLQQKLSLTDDQYKKALDINHDFFTKMIEGRMGSQQHPTPQQNQEMMADRNTKLKAVMTQEQAQKFDAMQPHPMQNANGAGPATK